LLEAESGAHSKYRGRSCQHLLLNLIKVLDSMTYALHSPAQNALKLAVTHFKPPINT